MDPPPYSAILKVDGDDPRACTACQSLRISYKDPKFNDLLTEEVFLDPRDTLLGENGLLLVNAAGVTALQQKSDRKHRWAQSAQTTVGSCRRDYLREQQYLLDELRRLQLILQNAPKKVEKDIEDLLEGAMKTAEVVAQDPTAVVSTDEIQYLAETTGGPRNAGDDDELFEFMGKMGLDGEDELTSRILLQKIRGDTVSLFEERARLREALEAMEGTSGGGGKSDEESWKVLAEEMMKVADKQDAGRKDIIETLLHKSETPDQHRAIEDVATKGLRQRYDAMFNKYQELEPKVERWHETLALSERQAARHLILSEEMAELEEEAQRRAEEARRKEREKEEAEAEKEAAEARRQRELAMMSADSLQDQIMDKLDAETQAKIKEEQYQVQVNRRRMDKFKEEIAQYQSEVSAFNDRKDDIRARISRDESEIADAEKIIAESEEMDAEVSERYRQLKLEEAHVKRRREELEDELNAAKKPPPKEKDTRKLQSEVEAAQLKNEELREHEAQLYEKEREYEVRFEQTDLAWKAYQEEEAAAALMAQLEAAERNQQMLQEMAESNPKIRGDMDPLLLDYKDRQFLPEYSEAARFNLLHMDNRARDRRLSKTRRGMAEDTAEQHLSRMMSTESEMASSSSGPKSQVPVNFRRPEDVKVRLRGAERNVGSMAGDLAAHGLHGARVAEDLHHLGRRLAASAAESTKIHADIPRNLTRFLRGDELPASVLRDQLVHALRDHQVCTSRAEDAWRLAEAGCTRGVTEEEMELEQEACARCEDDLISAARGLYTAARQAVHDGPSEVAPHAERCCEDWDAAEPELTEAAKVRNKTWPEILSLSSALAEERATQAHLHRHLKAEERRKSLLDAERSAPPAARRALAAMRAATSTTSRLSGALLE